MISVFVTFSKHLMCMTVHVGTCTLTQHNHTCPPEQKAFHLHCLASDLMCDSIVLFAIIAFHTSHDLLKLFNYFTLVVARVLMNYILLLLVK